MFNVYAHLHEGQIVYVGQGLQRRLSSFRCKNPTYSNTWRRFFKNSTPECVVLFTSDSKEEVDLQEWLAIKELQPILNVRNGGPSGRFLLRLPKSKNTKKKISMAQQGKPRATVGQNHGMYGKKHSTHSLRQNAVRNGAVPFHAVNLNSGIVLGPFFTRREAATELNIPSSSNISSCISGRLSSYKNFAFIKMDGV